MAEAERDPTDRLGVSSLDDLDLLEGIEFALKEAGNRSDQLGRTAAGLAVEFANKRHDLSLEVIENPELRQDFARYFSLAEEVYRKVGVEAPNPDEFAAAGVHFAGLSEIYNRLVENGKRPELVVYPILPLSDSGRPSWEGLFRSLSADVNVRMSGRGVMGVRVDHYLRQQSGKIRNAEESDLKFHHSVHLVLKRDGIYWGISVISGLSDIDSPIGPNPFINNSLMNSEKLALQAVLLSEGSQLIATDEWQMPSSGTHLDLHKGLYSGYDFGSRWIDVKMERGFGGHSSRPTIRG